MYKLWNRSNPLIFAIFFFLLGIIILVGKQALFQNVVHMIVLFMFALTIKDIFHMLNQKDWDKILENIINITFLSILLIYQKISYAIIPMLFAIYALIHGIVKLISYILLKIDRVSNRLPILLQAILFLTLGICFLFAPLFHLKYMLLILGIYSILLSLTYFNDFLDIAYPKRKHFLGRRIRITLPVFIESLIPYSVMNQINHLFSKNETIVLENKKTVSSPDIEILIHVSPEGSGKFGHVDMCIDNTIISYGGYDKNHRYFHDGIGSGVLFMTEKESYLKFCITYGKKTLFGFGLQLTKKQKKQIHNRIEKIQKELITWKPTLQEVEEQNFSYDQKDYQDYTNSLYRETKAQFYKFKKGKFKSYFVLGTNCVSFVDRIIGPSGIDIMKLNGIITPGTYYEYLNKEFLKKGSKVIQKNIYNQLYLERKCEMKSLFLEYPNCSTCKKAKLWLDTHNVNYESRHIVMNPPSQEELKDWIQKSNKPIEKFFNTSGIYYRQMRLKEKLPQMSLEEKLNLLTSNGMLIKRPIWIVEDKVYIGFQEKEWEKSKKDWKK